MSLNCKTWLLKPFLVNPTRRARGQNHGIHRFASGLSTLRTRREAGIHWSLMVMKRASVRRVNTMYKIHLGISIQICRQWKFGFSLSLCHGYTVSSKIHCDGDGSFDGREPKMVGGILSYLVGYFIMISDRISDTYCIQNYNEISKNQEWGSSEISDAIHRVGDMTGYLKSTLAPARKISLDNRFWYSGYIRLIAESKNKRAARRIGLTRNESSEPFAVIFWHGYIMDIKVLVDIIGYSWWCSMIAKFQNGVNKKISQR